MPPSLDILIRYLLDRQSSTEVEQGSRRVASEIDKVGQSADKLRSTTKKFGEVFPGDELGADFTKFQETLKKTGDTGATAYQRLRAEARLLRAEAKSITSDFEQARLAQLRGISSQLGSFSGTALALGTGITGGIFAAAAKYVNDAKTATEVTRQWKSEQLAIEQSGQRFGAVLAQEALPLLRQAAQLADAAADFVETNPEVIRAALNTGVVLAALGAVGIAVSKGIRIYADLQTLALGAQQLAAAKLQDLAADKMLAAAQLQAGKAGVTVSTAGAASTSAKGLGGLLGGITSPLGILTLVGATGITAIKAADGLKTLEVRLTEIGGPVAANINASLNSIIQTVAPLVSSIKGFRTAAERDIPLIQKALGFTSDAGGTAAGGASASSSLTVISPNQRKAIKAFEDYSAEDLRLVQDHYRDRQRIVNDSLNSERTENERYSASIGRNRAQTTKALQDADNNLARDNERASIENAQRQADVIRDGEQAIEEIRIRSADRLRKLAEDQASREQDFTATRDALGLANSRERYAKDVAEENRQTNLEIAQQRQDTAQRLAEFQQSYEQERAQRLADYQVRVEEIRSNAAAQLSELATQHAAEIRQIREQRVARIRELDSQFVEERRRRQDYLVNQLRDLDTAYVGEQNIRKQRQAQILQDLDAWLVSIRTRFQSLPTPSSGRSRYGGGYATYGQYLLGDDASGAPGKREYVIDGDTTPMLERMLGGMITPEKLMGRLSAGISNVNSRSVTYNDRRRINSRLSSSDRELMRSDALSVLEEALS